MTRKLWEISSELKRARDDLMAMDLPDEMITDTLSALDSEFTDKAIATAGAIRLLESEAASEKARIAEFQADIDRMLAAPKAKENRAKWLRRYLAEQMLMQGVDKIKHDNGPAIAITKRSNITIIPEAVPSEFVELVQKIDIMAAKAAVKKMDSLPNWATSTNTQSLRIG